MRKAVQKITALKSILTALMVVLGLAGCGDDETITGSGPDTSVIMPLTVGNIWTYDSQQFDTAGAVVSTQGLFIRIDSAVTVAGETWFVPFTVSVALLYTNRADGFWIWPEGEEAALAFKYPAEVGEVYDFGDYRMKVSSDNYPVTVPNGSYTCYRYIETHPGMDSDTVFHYYTPGVGLIKRDEYGIAPSGRSYLVSRWALTDYRLQ